MNTNTATASVEVACDPATAFDAFTADIGSWWKQGTRYWNDPEKGKQLRFEPHLGGRLTEVYDLETGEGFEIGKVTAWEPGKRLAFTWRLGSFSADESTDIEVEFAPTATGTLLTLQHSGWDQVASAPPGMAQGYSYGWKELLGFYVESTQAR